MFKVLWNFNDQIKTGLLLSLPVYFFKSVTIQHSYGKKVDCDVHFLRLSSVVARLTKCMRQPV